MNLKITVGVVEAAAGRVAGAERKDELFGKTLPPEQSPPAR